VVVPTAPDSPATFAPVLDTTAVHWIIRARGSARCARRYLDGTLVLKTTVTTPTGTLLLPDGLLVDEGDRTLASSLSRSIPLPTSTTIGSSGRQPVSLAATRRGHVPNGRTASRDARLRRGSTRATRRER
jgi:hypothetical protein